VKPARHQINVQVVASIVAMMLADQPLGMGMAGTESLRKPRPRLPNLPISRSEYEYQV